MSEKTFSGEWRWPQSALLEQEELIDELLKACDSAVKLLGHCGFKETNATIMELRTAMRRATGISQITLTDQTPT